MKYGTTRNKLIITFLFSTLLAIPALSQAATNVSKIFFFGDSLSDPGNLYALTGQTSKAPYLPIPDAAYSIGGHQFTNGKTWAQRLAQNVQSNNSGKAVMDAPGENGNYAFAGARARDNSGSAAPDFSTQVVMYASHYATANAEALYVMQFGGNDIRDALEATVGDPSGVSSFAIVQAAVTKTLENIQNLYAMGARKFFIVNVPDLSKAPVIRMANAEGFANFLIINYNIALESGLSFLDELEGISIGRFDMYGFTHAVFDNPEEYGLIETSAPCLLFFAETEAKCTNPETYFFWDGIHPTAVVHNAMSEAATEVMGGQ